MALHYCKHPGCRSLTRERYCREHAHLDRRDKRVRNQRYDAKRPDPSKRGYGSCWQTLRQMYLDYAAFTCERCGTKATLVHHRDHNPKNNCWENLEALCDGCHVREHRGKGPNHLDLL